MGKTSIRKGIGKVLRKKYLTRFTVALGRTKYLK